MSCERIIKIFALLLVSKTDEGGREPCDSQINTYPFELMHADQFK